MGAITTHDRLAQPFRCLAPQASIATRNLSSWSLYALLVLWIVSGFGLDLSALLVGGAILGVVVASASQASLGNLCSGLVLMLGRPYQVGAGIRLRSSLVGAAEYEGTVRDVHPLYTTLRSANGELLHLPNSAVATSALVVGRPPLQIKIEAELPGRISLHELQERIHQELGDKHAVVSLLPHKLGAAEEEPSLTCEVEVRSLRTVEPSAVAQALTCALSGSFKKQVALTVIPTGRSGHPELAE